MDFNDDLLKEAEEFNNQESADITINVSRELDKLGNLQNDIVEKEEELKNLKEKEKFLRTKEIPELMKSVGLTGVKLSDGTKVDVYTKWYISAKNKEEVYSWLINNGHGYLLKKEAKIQIEDTKIVEQISEQFPELSINLESSIHTKTLEAFFRSLKENNAELPEDLLNIYQEDNLRIKTN